MQPLRGDGEPPEQPRNEDEDDHGNEERRGDASGGEQDHGGQQSRDAKEHNRAPVFGSVDAPAGAEQEFEQVFHNTLQQKCTGRRGTWKCLALKQIRVQDRLEQLGVGRPIVNACLRPPLN
jgi:hypothetical protein